ncbi:MAG: response regulator [Planctomycetota bacterium]
MPSSGTKPRLFVVEDELVVARDIQIQLNGLGYDTVGHTDRAEEAILRVGELRPDLVLMDVQLAGTMDGIAAAQAIRDQFSIPVVFLTAFSNQETLERAKLTEPFGYVLKPFSERELQTVVEMALYKHKSETKLRTSEERFRQLAENIDEVFWISDPANTHVLYVSPAYEKVWGRTCESIYKNPREWFQAIHPEDREQVQKWTTQKLENVSTTVTYRIIRPDNSIRWISDRAFVLRNASGQAYRIVGTASDITETKNLEEHARKSQRMEAFGLMAGGVAHDFNNMMTIVIGYSDIWLSKLPANAPVRQALLSMKNAGERAANLTKQLLAFSRQTILALKVLDLNEVVNNSNTILTSLIGENNQLVLMRHPSLPKIKADPGQVEQILINLAINACDAMPTGGRFVIQTGIESIDQEFAKTHSELKPGTHVVLSVSDTGFGMSPETLEHIFEPFFTTKDVGKGTGLGLAVVHGVMAQSGGAVTVVSTVGVGTTFKLYFPIYKDITSSEVQAEDLALHSGHETILIVEDEISLLTMTSDVLQTFGYHVLTAHNGEEALKLLENNNAAIHLMLTDVVMPGKNGRELADAVKPNWPELKIIFMSGYTEDAVMRYGINHEIVAFIQKPFSPFALLKKIRSELDAK